jgi:hypothetical protein
VFAEDVNPHILAFEMKNTQGLIRHVFQTPHVGIPSYMFQIEHAELFEDVTTDLLVVSCAHLSECVRRFIIPLLALANELVKVWGIPPKKDRMKKRLHGDHMFPTLD